MLPVIAPQKNPCNSIMRHHIKQAIATSSEDARIVISAGVLLIVIRPPPIVYTIIMTQNVSNVNDTERVML